VRQARGVRGAILAAAVAMLCACSDGGGVTGALEPPASDELASADSVHSPSVSASPERSGADERLAVEPGEAAAREALLARRFMDPFEVQLSGAQFSEDASWRLVVAEEDGRDLSRMLMIGKGRGLQGR